jgi:rubrerythrin
MMTDNQRLIKIFEYALNQEETGMNFFEVSLQRMGIGAAAGAFERLIEEEKHHIIFISAILEELAEEREIDLSNMKDTKLEPANYFDDRAKSEFLEKCVHESMVPDVTVFNTAWLIEKDLSEYYDKMSDKTEGKASEALKMLARWEKEHERFFREFRDKLTETYSNMPWGG